MCTPTQAIGTPPGKAAAKTHSPSSTVPNITRADLPYALRGVVDYPHGRYLRIKVELGGSNPTVWMGVKGVVKPYEGAG